MRTSLIETQQIDAHLFNKPMEDRSVFEARLILDPTLQDTINWQKKTHSLINLYCRKKLREEIEAVHLKLFTQPKHELFRQKIVRLFTKL